MKNLLVLLFCAFAAFAAPAATPGEVPVGGVLRDAQMRGLSGDGARLSDFRGKPLIINVWASWCAPCRAEMGSLDRLARRHGRHFNIIGISTDDYSDRALAFLRDANTVFPHFIDTRLELEHLLGADRIPLTLLIDADGRVLHKVYGSREWDSPEAVEAIADAFGAKL